MAAAQRYPYLARDPQLGALSLAPLLPLTLTGLMGAADLSTHGLLDTGSTVNVLPFSIGQQLGAKWDDQKLKISLSGNLAAMEARALILSARIGTFPTIRLAFAWAKSDLAPLLLGQVNFFQEFNVCFFRSQTAFEVQPKAIP